MLNLGPDRLFLMGWRGVLRAAGGPAPGAPDLLAYLRSSCTRFFVFTNDVAETPTAHATWAWEHGLALSGDDFLTPSALAVDRIRARFPGRPVLVTGAPALGEALAAAGVPTAEERRTELPVVCAGPGGAVEEAALLARAAGCVRRGAPFYAVDPARLPPVLAATGRRPEGLGKPEPGCVDHALCRRPGIQRSGVVVVGGSRDAALARAAGVRGVRIDPEAKNPEDGTAVSAVDGLDGLLALLSGEADPMAAAWRRVSGDDERYY
jgi:ribonucleotide monophosphatase NagD (HAD superfamily)